MTASPNHFWIQVIIPAGTIPLEAFVAGVEKPTFQDVVAAYEATDKLEGWSCDGQWMVFYPSGVGGIGEREPSRKITPIRPTIIGVGRLDS